MAGMKIIVSTDVLKAKAQEIQGQMQHINQDWNKIQQTIKNSKSYWEGDASKMHQKYIEDIEDDASKVIKRLQENHEKLLKTAKIFIKTEKEMKEIAEALPSDAIK